MNKTLLMPLNLQFFAEEGTGAEVSEVAEPTTDVTEDSSTSTEGNTSNEESAQEDSNVQSAEENAKYAAARRRAEAEFKNRQAQMDAEFARRYGEYENPITHQKITSMQDYLDAMDAQEKLQREQELQEKGIDPRMFEDMVNRQVQNNPLVQQAQQVMQETMRKQANEALAEDLKVISSMNPNIKSFDDIWALPDADRMFQMCQQTGLHLADVYKLSHFDELMAGKSASAKQAALNTMNGTSHLNQTDSLANAETNEVEIPTGELEQWKRAFPHASMAELRKKYNSTL